VSDKAAVVLLDSAGVKHFWRPQRLLWLVLSLWLAAFGPPQIASPLVPGLPLPLGVSSSLVVVE